MAYMAFTAKRSEKDEVISAEEYKELGDWFVDKTEIPALPRGNLLCLDKQDSNEVLTSLKIIKHHVNFAGNCIAIIIITLFQEDNILGTDASLTYGSGLTNVECY